MAIYWGLSIVFEEELVAVSIILVSCEFFWHSDPRLYRRPTFDIGIPSNELKSLSSPPEGLLDNTIERESVSLGRLSSM